MATQDQDRWDNRYRQLDAGSRSSGPQPPAAFAEVADQFPVEGQALDIACGTGRSSVWLAERGMTVIGYDVSTVGIELARQEAKDAGCSDRCSFEVADLDAGLPAGDVVDLILCHMFRDARLDTAMVDRLKPGGLLAIAVLSEVGAAPGSFRATPGELRRSFGDLEVLNGGEAEGTAWLLGRATDPLADDSTD